MTEPSKPSMVSKAEEIFGGTASATASEGSWLTWEQFGPALVRHLTETSPFLMVEGTYFRQVKGRPKSLCPKCRLTIYKGTTFKGEPIEVDSAGITHDCSKKKGTTYEWGF